MILFWLLITVAVTAAAQTGTIQGQITDADSQPLPGLSVALAGTTQGDITNLGGKFTITDVAPDTYQLVISGVGYQTKQRSVQVSSGETQRLTVRLRASLTQLQEVEIVGRQETTYQNDVSFIGSKTATPLHDVPQSGSWAFA